MELERCRTKPLAAAECGLSRCCVEKRFHPQRPDSKTSLGKALVKYGDRFR
jgi:hypothetical protein